MYVWGHSYEFDHDSNWELMETFCEMAGGHEDIWYATNLEYVHYIKACERLMVSAALDFAYNPSVLPVWLEAAGRILEVPGGQTVQLS
ncbi:hypothetical protein D3C81_2085930 [compost metagenome]